MGDPPTVVGGTRRFGAYRRDTERKQGFRKLKPPVLGLRVRAFAQERPRRTAHTRAALDAIVGAKLIFKRISGAAGKIVQNMAKLLEFDRLN